MRARCHDYEHSERATVLAPVSGLAVRSHRIDTCLSFRSEGREIGLGTSKCVRVAAGELFHRRHCQGCARPMAARRGPNAAWDPRAGFEISRDAIDSVAAQLFKRSR
jgi:hypothetical protein